MTSPTYSPPFLHSPFGQQTFGQQTQPYGQQTQLWPQGSFGQPAPFGVPSGFEQLQQLGPAQQPPGFQAFGVQAPGAEQIAPSLYQIATLLGNAQQLIWTAQHVLAQLPIQVAMVLQQTQQQYAQRQFQRPYSMAW